MLNMSNNSNWDSHIWSYLQVVALEKKKVAMEIPGIERCYYLILINFVGNANRPQTMPCNSFRSISILVGNKNIQINTLYFWMQFLSIILSCIGSAEAGEIKMLIEFSR